MALNVSGVMTQRNLYNTYFPGDDDDVCSCGECTAFTDQRACRSVNGSLDWQFEYVKCCAGFCTEQPGCSELNPSICPLIGGTRGSARWDSGSDNFFLPSQGRQIECTYKTTDFKDSNDINTWINTFGKNASFNTIMSAYCPQQAVTGTCPIFPTEVTNGTVCGTGGLTGCSRFYATNDDGTLCGSWAVSEPKLAGAAAQSFCDRNTCAQDCRCYNRDVVDPIYIEFTQAPDGPPITLAACWYQPCQQTPPYLIPLNQEIQPNTCPSTVCQQVNNVIGNQGSTVNIDVAKEIISCSVNAGGGGSSGQPVSTYWNKYYTWIIIGGVALLAIIIMFVIVAAATRSKSNK